jgi:hypothetical protein
MTVITTLGRHNQRPQGSGRNRATITDPRRHNRGVNKTADTLMNELMGIMSRNGETAGDSIMAVSSTRRLPAITLCTRVALGPHDPGGRIMRSPHNTIHITTIVETVGV